MRLITTYNCGLRAALAVVLVGWGCTSLAAQTTGPWATSPRERGLVSSGLPVSPFFEGWYENPDGTFTLSFGYFNRNREEALSLPLGADNFIEPAQYNGTQPTVFMPGRDTGVFTVTVPADFAINDGRVVWTLDSGDVEPHSVPGKVGIETYRRHHGPMAMGSMPALLKLGPDGPELWGPMTVIGDPSTDAAWSEGRNPPGNLHTPIPLTASSGSPLPLTVWVADRMTSNAERDPVEAGVTWFTHQGPASAVFADEEPVPGSDGRATTSVTFPETGVYMLRVRADNFNPVDSTPGDQCCWTNGYLRVVVGS